MRRHAGLPRQMNSRLYVLSNDANDPQISPHNLTPTERESSLAFLNTEIRYIEEANEDYANNDQYEVYQALRTQLTNTMNGGKKSSKSRHRRRHNSKRTRHSRLKSSKQRHSSRKRRRKSYKKRR